MGKILFDNLPLIFAVSIALGMSKRRKEVAALAAIIAFFVMHATINALLCLDGSIVNGVATGSHMVYILPLSCYKNNEQLFNKSCQEQQKISRIGSCFRGSRGILQILFPYFCIFHTAPGTVICLSARFFVCTDTNIISASLFQTGKCSGQCTGGHCPGPSHGP